MGKSWLIIFFLVISCSIFAAAGAADDKVSNPITQIDSLITLAKKYRETDIERFGSYIMEAYKLAIQTKNITAEGSTIFQLSEYFFAKGQYVRSAEYRFKLIDIYERLQSPDRIIESYNHLAGLFIYLKDFTRAKRYLEQAIKLLTASKDINLKGRIYFNLSYCYTQNKEIEPAIRYLYLSMIFFRSTKDLMNEGKSYKFLGDVSLMKQDYNAALFYYNKALAIFSGQGDETEQAITLTRISHVFQVTKNYLENLRFNLKALAIRQKAKQEIFVAYSYNNVGEAYWLLGKKDSAQYFINKAISLAEKLNDLYTLEAINWQLSIFASEDKNYEKAFEFYDKAANYRKALVKENTRSEVGLMEARRIIVSNQAHNRLLNQEYEYNKLNYQTRRFEIIIYEIVFIGLFLVILAIELLIVRNKRRKNELEELNRKLDHEICVRKKAEENLKRSEELHRLFAENSADVISMFDSKMKRIYISPSCFKFYGYTQEKILGFDSFLTLIEPDFHSEVMRQINDMLRLKKHIRYSYKALHQSGKTLWVESIMNPVIDVESGEIREIISVVRDISILKKHEEDLNRNARQKEYLLREIHNRVKNNFSILISLMAMQLDKSDDSVLGSSLKDLQLRVRTMSLVHEHLYHTQKIDYISFDDYLLRLSFNVANSFNNDRIKLKTEIHHCIVPIEIAMPLGLIINELMTNSYKYAFPGTSSGMVRVTLFAEEENSYCLTVGDDGVGLPEGFSIAGASSMGSQIIRLLLEQLEAKMEITGNPGCTFRINFSTQLG
ncbi:MAG: PAS domain S-box protein [Alphaproteobacteria bacterium]|nr:PAS domain S-box protein [Alphaproteobacteria bacterium]